LLPHQRPHSLRKKTLMARSRKFLTVGALGVASFALIGAGATATFTDSARARQNITAGTMSLLVTSPGGSTSSDGRTVTLPDFGPTGSEFQTHNKLITIRNTGNITATHLEIDFTDSNNGSNASLALRSQTNLCMFSDPWVTANGPLTRGEAREPASISLNKIDVKPGETTEMYVDFYAGMDSARCDKVASTGPMNDAAWGPYVTPASLTNEAQGGVITPMMTFKFTG